VFFSVFKEGLSGQQIGLVIGVGATLMPLSFIIKFIIFSILKLGDGDNELEAEEEDEDNEGGKGHNNEVSQLRE